MARAKKNERKWTPEERAIDVWNQQAFFIRKKFPQAEKKIQMLQKQFMETKDDDFVPTEEATNALRELYVTLSAPSPAPGPNA